VQHVWELAAPRRRRRKNFERQRGWLFVSLELRIDGTLELVQEIETKEHSYGLASEGCAGFME
jgi:hypothetical protein